MNVFRSILRRVYSQKIRIVTAFLLAVSALIFIYSVTNYLFLASWKGIVFTCFLAAGLFVVSLFPVGFVLKEILFLSRRDTVLWVIASMVTGGIVSTFLPQPVNPLTLFSQKVKIESVNIGTQQCNPVELTGFRVDGDFISYAAFSNEGWTREDTRMIAGTAENYLEWKGYARNIVISLAGREEGCSARISINGTPSEYSTYSDPTEEILVHLEFSQPDWISWLTGTAIGFLASAMFLFLFSIFHRIFVWSGISDRIRSFKTIEQKDVHLICLLIVISMAGYLYITHTFNLLFEGDSGSYISAGYSLAAGNGYIADNGDDFDWWPPLYPILISGGYRQHTVDVDIYLRLLIPSYSC